MENCNDFKFKRDACTSIKLNIGFYCSILYYVFISCVNHMETPYDLTICGVRHSFIHNISIGLMSILMYVHQQILCLSICMSYQHIIGIMGWVFGYIGQIPTRDPQVAVARHIELHGVVQFSSHIAYEFSLRMNFIMKYTLSACCTTIWNPRWINITR